MIKILSTRTSAVAHTGVNARIRTKDHGQLGEGSKRCDFQLGSLRLKTAWEDRRLDATLIADESLYIRSVSLIFRIRSPKPSSEMVIWSESYSNTFRNGNFDDLPGGQTGKSNRHGYWGMWMGESEASQGIFLGQEPPVVHPVSFRCQPASHQLTVTWTVNRCLGDGETIDLPVVSIRRGDRETNIDAWRKRWVASTNRSLPTDRRRGWLGGDEISSPKHLQECLSSLRGSKIPLDWFAMGPNYTNKPGEWLESSEEFHDRMGSVSRSISEANLIPGIRFAPFLISKNAAQKEERREWLVGGANGSPLTVPAYPSGKESFHVLDITHPDVAKHLQETLLIMRDRWGFRAFVLERFGDAFLPGHRYNDEAGPGELMEQAGAVIREAVGKRVLLIGSGVPLLGTTGVWDAVFTTPAPQANMPARHLTGLSSSMIHRSPWNEGSWINVGGPLSLELFRNRSEEIASFRHATLLSSGMVVMRGDPRTMKASEVSDLLAFLAMFDECRKGRLRLGRQTDGGRVTPLVVRNEKGWVALFNFAGKKRSIRLDRDSLKSTHGVITSLSTGDGAVFNSPEIHVSLPPWGHRLFRG